MNHEPEAIKIKPSKRWNRMQLSVETEEERLVKEEK